MSVIQLRPPKPQPSPDPEQSYRDACAAFLFACFDRWPKAEIKRAAIEMGHADVNRFYAKRKVRI